MRFLRGRVGYCLLPTAYCYWGGMGGGVPLAPTGVPLCGTGWLWPSAIPSLLFVRPAASLAVLRYPLCGTICQQYSVEVYGRRNTTPSDLTDATQGVEDSGKIGFKGSRIQGFERSPSTTTGNINRF